MMLLKISQVAERLNLSESKVYQLVSNGSIASLRMDGSIRIEEAALVEYLDRCRYVRRERVWAATPRPVRLKHLK
jgi:excisionase family DNA binding protein